MRHLTVIAGVVAICLVPNDGRADAKDDLIKQLKKEVQRKDTLVRFLQSQIQNLREPEMVLQVVRLKPGSTQSFELAPLHEGSVQKIKKITADGMTGGRTLFRVELLPTPASKNKFVEINPDKGVYSLRDGLTLAWKNDRPRVSFSAARGAKAGTMGVRIIHQIFSTRPNSYIGFQVVVEGE